MVAIADIGLRERSFDNLGLMGLELLKSPEFISEWNAFVEDTGKFLYAIFTSIVWSPDIWYGPYRMGIIYDIGIIMDPYYMQQMIWNENYII